MLTRALLAFIALPGVVAFAVPLFLARHIQRSGSFQAIALVPLLAGAALLVWCVREFYVVGKGTVAPWSPPRRLVTSGPYRVSRNPIYVAVSLVLLGWAIGFASGWLLLYAVAVAAAFHLRVVFGEEPRLARAHRDDWKRYAPRVPRWLFPSRRALLLAWLGLAVALPMAGLIYEAYADARDARRFPPPGMMVDIGGRRLHLLCIGDGVPTVMFEPSGWASATSSPNARERIAARTTVCSYDRAGGVWSDPAPGAVSIADLARDLAVLQDRARLRAPFVIVAASIGGLTAEMFARQYPERMAGLVFVDAASSLSLPRLAASPLAATTRVCAAGYLARLGVIRLLDPFNLGHDSEEALRAAAASYNARPWGLLCALARGLPASLQAFEQAPPLRADLPLTVLSASSAADLLPPGWEEAAAALRPDLTDSHQRLAKRSTRGTWRLVPDSTHLIGNSQPEAVVEAVLDILDTAR